MALASLCAVANAWVLEVNTPTLTQCKAGYLSWAGKNSPYNVTIINQKSGQYLKTFGAITGTNYTWTVDLPSGRNVALKVVDAKGNINYSNGVFIKNSTDSTCVTSDIDASTNATVSAIGMPTVTGNATTNGVTSGGIGPNAAAQTADQSSASRITAGLGLLLACSALALVA
jgi:hypothetical protein